MSKRVWCGVAVAVVAMSVSASSVASDAPPGIGFDETTRTVTLDDLRAGITESLCNSTAADVHVALRVPADGSGDDASGDLQLAPASADIGTGQCIDIDITLGANVDGGALAGTTIDVIAVSSGAGSARTTIEISAAEGAVTAAAAFGAIDLHGPLNLCSTDDDKVWSHCPTVTPAEATMLLRYDGDAAPTIEADVDLATLADDNGHLATLRSTHASAMAADGVVGVPVALDGADETGTFTGQLDTAFGGTADKPIAISFTVTGLTATAVGSTDVHGSFDRHSRSTAREGGIVLQFEGATPPVIPAGTEIAVLATGNDTARLVTTKDAVQVGDHQLAVAVRLLGARGVGVYKGNLDPSIAGSVDSPTAVSFTVASNFWLAIGAAVLGLLIGFVVKLVVGRLRPWIRWKRIRDDWSAEYRAADERLQASFANVATRFAGPTEAAISARRQTINDAVAKYGDSAILFDPGDATYQSIETALSTVDGDIDNLGNLGSAGFGRAVIRLDERIDQFVDAFKRDFPRYDAPLILDAIVKLANQPVGFHAQKHAGATSGDRRGAVDTPRHLPVGGATAFVADAGAAVALMDRWHEQGERLRRMRVWGTQLYARIFAAGPGAVVDLALLHREFYRLREVQLELLWVRDAKEFDAAHIEGDLDAVYAAFSALGSHYLVFVPSDWMSRDIANLVAATKVVNINVATAYLTGAEMPPATSPLDLDAIRRRAGPWEEPADGLSAIVGAVSARLGYFALELVVLALAALPGYLAFRGVYDDKPWGTSGDYLALILASATAEIVLGGVIALVKSRLRPVPAITVAS